jgi:methionine-rich copper-binding protein CopC
MILGAAVAVAVLVPAAPVAAHTELTATGPADGATVTTPIEDVTLTFSGPVRADGSTVTVTGPDGVASQGQLTVLDTTVHQPVTPLRSGPYRVDWSVVAGDGHAITGSFGFTLALPPELEEPSPSPIPSPSTTGQATDGGRDSSAGPWLVTVGTGVLIIALVLLLRRRGRSAA